MHPCVKLTLNSSIIFLYHIFAIKFFVSKFRNIIFRTAAYMHCDRQLTSQETTITCMFFYMKNWYIFFKFHQRFKGQGSILFLAKILISMKIIKKKYNGKYRRLAQPLVTENNRRHTTVFGGANLEVTGWIVERD